MANRERSIRVRMNDEDLWMLSAVAKREGLSHPRGSAGNLETTGGLRTGRQRFRNPEEKGPRGVRHREAVVNRRRTQ